MFAKTRKQTANSPQPLSKALCEIENAILAKVIGKVFLLMLVFLAGYLIASWRFVYSSTWLLEEPIEISAGQEKGILPKGTELHYQSMAHGDIDFYVFIRIPKEKAKELTTKVEVDTYNGINRLRGGLD